MKLLLFLIAVIASAQTTVSLNGTNYTLQGHPRVWLDGPSGSLTAAMSDASNRAQTGNPGFQALINNVTFWKGANVCSTAANTYSGTNCAGAGATPQPAGSNQLAGAIQAAFLWFSQGANPSDPNGYLAIAKSGYDHLEDFSLGSFACDETATYCNRDLYDIFNEALFTDFWVGYSMIRSQLSAPEITAITGKVFNDNDTSHNGLNAVACTKQIPTPGPGAISVSGNVVTGTGTNFMSSLSVGSVLWAPWATSGVSITAISNPNSGAVTVTAAGYSASSNNPIFISGVTGQTSINGEFYVTVIDSSHFTINGLTGNGVSSSGGITYITGNAPIIGTVFQIVSNTQVILTTSSIAGAVSGPWAFAAGWSSGSCGLVWFMKHHQVFPHLISAQSSHYQTDYPSTGGCCTADDNNVQEILLKQSILAGLALADDDARAGTLLTQSYNYFYNFMYPKLKQGWDGYNQGGANYGAGTWFGVWEIALAVRNSVVSGPDLTVGNWLTRAAPYLTFEAIPNDYGSCAPWGDGFGCTNSMSIHNEREGFMGCYIAAGATGALSPDCQAFYNFLRNVRTDYTAGGWNDYPNYYYTFYNFNATSATPATSQYIFSDHDITYATCNSTFTQTSPTGVPACEPNQYWGDAITRSDWTTTATHVLIKGGWDSTGQDHTSTSQQGGFHVFRNVPLISGDNNSQGDGDCNEGTPGNCNVYAESMIDLGGNVVNAVTSYAPFTRWASTDPSGDSSSRYAYTMVDMSTDFFNSSVVSVTRAQRHIMHFKKSGAQDYIVGYDDLALSAAPSWIHGYFHFFLNGIAPATAITFSNGSKTATNLQTAAGAKLNFALLAPAGSTTNALVVDNANGTYTSGNGNTFRAYECPSSNGTTCNNSATSMEGLWVAQPINGTSGSMPSLSQITPSTGAARVAQIADGTTPKVAAFATGGSTITALNFTTTHSGTGQYLVAGLTAGTYTVTAPSGPFSCTVAANDNTIYFESTAGAVSIAASGGAVGGTTTKNTVNINVVKN